MLKAEKCILDIIDVPKPCDVPWDGMLGNDRVRTCSQCALSVYNLSDMSKKEAEQLLLDTEGKICARFYRRADGTIVTDNCPVMLRALRDSFKTAVGIAATALTFVLSIAAVRADNAQPSKDSSPADKGSTKNVRPYAQKPHKPAKHTHGTIFRPHTPPDQQLEKE